MIRTIPPLIEKVRRVNPLVHHITNYVTVNDCANITLACGASPIMADAIEEAEDIVSIASALVINMGILNSLTVPAMLEAGKAANKAGVPVIFDPVGAGASKFRNETAERILREIRLSVLRGNISEIRFLAGLSSETKGVDADEGDLTGAEQAGEIAGDMARRLGCVVAITGAVDVVSDGARVLFIKNGHPMLSRITGTGCMCSSLIGSFCGASRENLLEATAAAIAVMGIAGETAFEKAGKLGTGSFRMELHNAVSLMDEATIAAGGKIYEA